MFEVVTAVYGGGGEALLETGVCASLLLADIAAYRRGRLLDCIGLAQCVGMRFLGGNFPPHDSVCLFLYCLIRIVWDYQGLLVSVLTLADPSLPASDRHKEKAPGRSPQAMSLVEYDPHWEICEESQQASRTPSRVSRGPWDKLFFSISLATGLDSKPVA